MSRRQLPDLNGIKRVLIIRLSAIGDVIHALPLASALKDAYPHLEISWLVEEIPADVVSGNPDMERTIVVPRSRWKKGRMHSPSVWKEYLEFLGLLRSHRFDLTIDLQGYAKSALFALATGAKYRVGWWRMRDGANLVSRPLPRRAESVHRVDWFLDVARALGVENPCVRSPIFIPDDARASVQEKLKQSGFEPGARYAVINQAAGNPPRRWGLRRFAALTARVAERYGLPSALVGTQAEAADCEEIVRLVTANMRERGITDIPVPVNLAGRTDLKELAALLDGCSVHISGDTGSTHLAAALGIPVVAFYGSTDPAHAGPWNQSDHVLARKDLCSPNCTIRQCAYGSTGSPSLGASESAEFVGAGVPPLTEREPMPRTEGRAAALGASKQAKDYDGQPATALCLGAISVEQAIAVLDGILPPIGHEYN